MISLVAVGQKITAALANLLIGSANAQGQSLVAPSSVAGTGSSVTALGVVNLSGCNAVTINGVFTSKYTNYRIVVDVTISTGDSVFARLAVGGTANGSSNYDNQRSIATGASVAGSQALAISAWLLSASTATNLMHSIELDLFGPAIAAPCMGLVDSVATNNPMTTAAAIAQYGLSNRLASAFDGIEIYCPTATMTGQISIYGFNAGV